MVRGVSFMRKRTYTDINIFPHKVLMNHKEIPVTLQWEKLSCTLKYKIKVNISVIRDPDIMCFLIHLRKT